MYLLKFIRIQLRLLKCYQSRVSVYQLVIRKSFNLHYKEVSEESLVWLLSVSSTNGTRPMSCSTIDVYIYLV